MKTIKFAIFLRLCTLFALMLLFVSGCSVYEIQERDESFNISGKWVLLPFINHSDTPEAGERAADIAMTLLHAKGMTQLIRYVPDDDNQQLPELNQQKALVAAMDKAAAEGYQYAVTGSVQEWRYKSGLDAEPVTGITLNVVDVKSHQMLWSASGSRTGWGRDNVSGVAHKVMAVLIDGLKTAD